MTRPLQKCRASAPDCLCKASVLICFFRMRGMPTRTVGRPSGWRGQTVAQRDSRLCEACLATVWPCYLRTTPTRESMATWSRSASLAPIARLARLLDPATLTTTNRLSLQWWARPTLLLVALLLLGAFTPATRGDQSLVHDQQHAFRAALNKAAPAIVRIDTIGGVQDVRSDGEGGGFRTADGPTTGVIWSADGLILSSTFNFVRDPSVITVNLADGRRLIGKLLARDHQSRLALLKVEAANLPIANWVEPRDLRSGQWAITAGFGYGSSAPAMSVGVLSGLNRMAGQCVQTDAKTSPGNYGGPLLDIEGDVIGICVPMGTGDDEFAGVDQYDSGIGFAVQVDHIRRRITRLASGESLHRGLLGLVLDTRDPVVGEPSNDLQPTTQLPPATQSKPAPQVPLPRGAPDFAASQEAPKLPPRPQDGLLIIGDTRGPSAGAGLQRGDKITAVDGEPVIRLLDFRRIVSRKAAGDTVEVDFSREEKASTVKMTLWKAEDFKPATKPASQSASAPANP